MFRLRLVILNLILLAVLAASGLARRQDESPVSSFDFLKHLDLPFRGLKTSDQSLSKDETSLLQPDAVLVRRYSSADGMQAELAVVAGHHKRSVHTPGFCMLGGGWDILWQQGGELRIPARTLPIPTMRMLMSKHGKRLLVTYFFTDGGYCTRSLVQFQGYQFVRRLHLETHEGALVRIITPMNNSEELAGGLTEQFAQSTIPPVLSALRTARLPIQR